MTEPTRTRVLRAVLLGLVVLAVVVVLFTFVFPAVTEMLQNPTLG